MKHPFWIANSTLLCFFLLTCVFVYFSRIRPPRRTSIDTDGYARSFKKEEVAINIKKIYEDDLFDTFRREMPVYKQPDYTLDIPPVPQPEMAITPEEPKPTFLAPLNISLRGIIFVSKNEEKNRVIIADNTTNRETTYKLGDNIEDAQIIRIFNKKIILLRSNGQQEVLYLREHDAQLDPSYALMTDWQTIVQQTGIYSFTVAPQAFIKRVTNLAQFIDILSFSTAYQQGKSIGCRIGELTQGSLGQALGFATGDIVTHINDIPATTTDLRLQIYNAIIATPLNESITATVLRRNQELPFTFMLKEFAETSPTQMIQNISPQKERKKKENLLRQKHKFAPTIHELHQQEKQFMMERGHILKS